jgi:hypothetical protein
LPRAENVADPADVLSRVRLSAERFRAAHAARARVLGRFFGDFGSILGKRAPGAS